MLPSIRKCYRRFENVTVDLIMLPSIRKCYCRFDSVTVDSKMLPSIQKCYHRSTQPQITAIDRRFNDFWWFDHKSKGVPLFFFNFVTIKMNPSCACTQIWRILWKWTLSAGSRLLIKFDDKFDDLIVQIRTKITQSTSNFTHYHCTCICATHQYCVITQANAATLV